MKLANKAYVVTLLMLTLVFSAMAQSQRSDKDPRNTAPTVGTGGSVGGPTGLFTVYDGTTLRKKEFTFSAAYSNYDRDPGNADFTSMPLSFQAGVTNNFEVFFTTEAYRGIKVNNPRALSSFYLPNSQVVIDGVYRSGPAIVLAPIGLGSTINGAVFRPTGAQPFVQFPFVGGSAGTYGFTSALGGVGVGGNGASNFYGIGSVYGSILPGIVLATGTNPVVGSSVRQIPTSFTVAPTYLPDAPFINRGYGESAFNSFTFGGKWRFTSNDNPIGAGIVASYTYYKDNADSISGFNQMQRGAGAGGNMGDLNVTGFADARLAKWVNLSGNVGYTYTTKAKGAFTGGTFTLLDRPDELHAGIGVDFPVNKYFQPIAELTSTRYVGGRTPNALENNPLDGIIGARIFVTRWASIGLAYRRNFNQQDARSFENDPFNTSVNVGCNVQSTNCVPVVVNTSFTGVPPGFLTSNDPNGYIVQVAVGRRNKRLIDVVNQPAVIDSVNLDKTEISIGCPPGQKSASGACDESRSVSVATSAHDPENDTLVYNYTVSGGRIVGSGANVSWDLSEARPGTYTITTGVDDGCGVCGKTETRTVTIKECADCQMICSCPSLSVSGPAGTTAPGQSMTFTANVSGTGSYTYNWSVSSGTITSGQGTSSITVETTNEMAGQTVTATVDLGGVQSDCGCTTNASETAGVQERPRPQKVDEFGTQKDDEVKARVDNFYIQLNNDPTSRGVIINYGTPAQIKHRRGQIMKAINFRKYDLSRITFVDGGNTQGGEYSKFWVVPTGADAPTPDME